MRVISANSSICASSDIPVKVEDALEYTYAGDPVFRDNQLILSLLL